MLIGRNELKRNFQLVIGRITELNNKKMEMNDNEI
jgi:hypothetical protein